jgi:hypothetical protein
MSMILRILALALLLGSVGWWLATGASRGWTQTSVPVKTVDETTGLEGVEYQRRLVPGVDLLGAGLLGAAALAGGAFLVRNRPQPKPTS